MLILCNHYEGFGAGSASGTGGAFGGGGMAGGMSKGGGETLLSVVLSTDCSYNFHILSLFLNTTHL